MVTPVADNCDKPARRARDGICLLLNNQNESAEEMFEQESDNIEMASGKCFISFINALLSYEPERLQEAVDGLKKLEERCNGDIGWIRSVKNQDPDAAERLEEQIILADTHVCAAVLIFLQPDISSYLRGGWRLRKAWKVYQHTYATILDLYQRTFPSGPPVPGSDFPSGRVLTHSASSDPVSDWTTPSSPAQPKDAPGILRTSMSYLSSLSSFAFSSPTPQTWIPPDEVARLMSAVSFGYGVFQLCASLLPPSFLRFVHVLGFESNRQMGLDALMFARQGTDMRGPLAMLALLWYHTIVRSFLALDGCNVQAGVDVASQLYEESKTEFSDSALFLFFLGRIQRLKSNVPEALKAFENAIEKSPQREIQLLCLHEVGWCYLIQLDWKNAFYCFEKLCLKSRWSKLFYTYVAAVCVGASGDTATADKLIQKLPKYLKRPVEGRLSIETFVARRVRILQTPTTQSACALLGMELLYVWNAAASSDAQRVLDECEKCEVEPIIGLRSLIQGVVLSSQGNLQEAEDSLRQCLSLRKDIRASPSDPEVNDDHVTAFAGLELALILIQRRETEEEGKNLLIRIRDTYKDYDFENKVTIRIHAALKHQNNPESSATNNSED